MTKPISKRTASKCEEVAAPRPDFYCNAPDRRHSVAHVFGDVAKLAKKADFDIKYQGVAKFPAVTRDISLVMKKTVLAGQIEEVIRKSGGKLLEDYHLFDIYEGENVGKDEKSLAYSIRFRAKDRTLEDKDVSAVMDKILKKLENLGVALRQ